MQVAQGSVIRIDDMTSRLHAGSFSPDEQDREIVMIVSITI